MRAAVDNGLHGHVGFVYVWRGECCAAKFPWQWNIVFCAELQCARRCDTKSVMSLHLFCLIHPFFFFCSPCGLTSFPLSARFAKTFTASQTKRCFVRRESNWQFNSLSRSSVSCYFNSSAVLPDSSGSPPRAAIGFCLSQHFALPFSPLRTGVNCSSHGNNDSA